MTCHKPDAKLDMEQFINDLELPLSVFMGTI